MNLGMCSEFIKLPCASNADLAATDVSADFLKTADSDYWIEFTLTGSMSEAQITLDGRLPEEFTNAITVSIRRQIETQCSDSETKLRLALNSKLDDVCKRLDLVARNGQQTVAKQREALATMHLKLEQNLQSREDFEYARLPTKPILNH